MVGDLGAIYSLVYAQAAKLGGVPCKIFPKLRTILQFIKFSTFCGCTKPKFCFEKKKNSSGGDTPTLLGGNMNLTESCNIIGGLKKKILSTVSEIISVELMKVQPMKISLELEDGHKVLT